MSSQNDRKKILTIMKSERDIKAQSLTGLEEYLENANSFK